MCGIAGIYSMVERPVDLRLLERMTQVLAHRGPDGEGYVLLAPRVQGKPLPVIGRLSDSLRSTTPGYTIGLGHRRLAVLDCSPLGHQPMSSEDERTWITYNGEIYNYLELREELQGLGRRFRSTSDTEVILHAYREWGPACLPRLNGMFAFAVWDGVHDRLFCARDRLGMKPLYYRVDRERLAFGSEIKALLEDAGRPTAPNQRMVHDFLAFGLQDHTEETFFDGILQLRPGHYLVAEGGRLNVGKWWDLEPSAPQAAPDDESAIRSFRALFDDTIRIHLRSDVAVGSCLSGGLDSSSIVCTMRRLLAAGPRLKTFSSCFAEPACDERPYLNLVVAQAGTESVEVFPDGRRLYDEMPRILWFQEEPFGGTSYLAQWAVMRAAAEHGVKVLLDGQGGDELLCGYPGYWGSYGGDLIRNGNMRRFAHEALAYGRQQARLHPTVYANFARALLPLSVVSRARTWLKGQDLWMSPEFASRYADSSRHLLYGERFPSAVENHVAAYLQSHSLPALLHHEDRNAMAFSIEARLPFLDARLVDFSLRLPTRLKLRNGRSKFILREAMAGVLLEAIRQRTDKMGFVTPQDRWLRETLRPQLEDLFSTRAFEQRGYWDPSRLRTAYREYCEGRHQLGASVWRWVSLELWHQRFFP
ncbi:MAG: asparagine synthase (glutamine-hydrolyzing) [Nitrospiraceae bacterium]|nr:MAG: asparagine synthase (glutamine-hydrolyzing) [Nitrospiraceae bacterium]